MSTLEITKRNRHEDIQLYLEAVALNRPPPDGLGSASFAIQHELDESCPEADNIWHNREISKALLESRYEIT